ncbi:competence/damage-inducible protein A [Kamptonema cortianum]|nr:competence/damage-inducible protein A [Oscillatoria laete-virens]MDK3159649.1 competence/damage-inducible protein A [Kamptonema cortianum]MDL5050295.1 competence/damage-inducible protein A [Oscillatoria amoena NRMC-F 0135]MDL5055128.1 competence/damage-inducible protein A [Oscillatoria laete-virens NRMC-F 0139]
MNVEVINTGSELLLGFVTNTHVGYMARALAPLGLTISRQTTVPDGPDIGEIFSEALSRSDIILITGGLGPTSDDITRDIVAGRLGRKLLRDEETIRKLDAFFLKRGLALAQMNYRQADYPEGARILDNPHGTAPGLHIEEAGKHIFLLPGPPRELHPMFDNHVLPALRRVCSGGDTFHCHILRMTGIGESSVAKEIAPLLEKIPELQIGYCARIGEVDLRLISPSPETIANAAQIARDTFQGLIFTEHGETLEQAVIRLAGERSMTMATAESCTGGMIAHRLTNVPGSSTVFRGGIVSYANEVKENILNVNADDLRTHGAVSEVVAVQMAANARKLLEADLAVSTTGIAGPGGGSPEKPVGLVYIALATPECTRAWKCHYLLDRESFKRMVAQFALDRFRRQIARLPLD